MVPNERKRVAFTVHYDGGSFFGWQLQRGLPSVQGELERVLSRLFDQPTRVVGAGRTDRGVHAIGQVATAEVPVGWEPRALRRAMNALLHRGVWIAHLDDVDLAFHPRYNALSRSYVYRLGTAELAHSPFSSPWCWAVRDPVDIESMRAATAVLPGEHSFLAFAKAGQESRGDRCRVDSAGWHGWADMGFEFRVTANRFLHHMVRYLVGTLVEIGQGRRPIDDMSLLLERPDEAKTSPPAPPQGLFLSGVAYPPGAYRAPDDAAPTAFIHPLNR
jgi:tRNA pseudouridine38-40 synthase